MTSKVINVALIDDDEEDYILTKDLLSEIELRKYNLDWVPNYEKGLEVIRQNKHDAYLVDYRLGARDGLELIAQAIAEGSKSPMILLTGQGTLEIDERAMSIGAADYLIKGSFDHSTLDRAIRYAIRHFDVLGQVRSLHEESEQRVQKRTYELAKTVRELEQANKALKKQVEEREQAEEALIVSRNFMLTMAKSFPSGSITAIDKDWKYVFAEGMDMAEKGVETKDLVGRRLQEGVSEEEFLLLEEPIKRAFNGETSSFEFRSNDRYYIIYAVPLPDKNNKVSGVMLVNQDITERKKAETEALNALQKERELNELKSRFVSMASHEFRTPLATILSSLTLIERYNKDGDEEKRAKHIARIKSSVGNLVSILNDFLSMDKLEEGMITNRPEKFDLTKLCQDIREEMQVMAKQGQIITYRHYGAATEVVLDEQLLRNILINLLSNAVKYSDEGKVVSFETVLRDNQLELTVTDQGIGIPIEDQQHVFSTFFRANNVTNIQGTGLGLNIVKKYLDLMGGQINFVSEPQKGSIFKVKFDL